MKKILALLSAAIFSVFNKLDVFTPISKFFTPDSLYTVSKDSADHSAIYSRYFSTTQATFDECDNVNLVQGSNPSTVGDKQDSPYWLLPTPFDKKFPNPLPKNTELIAPYSMIVTYVKLDNPQELEAITIDGNYKFKITGLKRLYCCMKKEQANAYSHTMKGHAAEGDSIPAGYVMGETSDATKLTIFKADDKGELTQEVDLDTFYSLSGS